MAKFLVQKSEPLNGEVVISGAKNAVLPLMASAILAEEKCEIRDVPALRDVRDFKVSGFGDTRAGRIRD